AAARAIHGSSPPYAERRRCPRDRREVRNMLERIESQENFEPERYELRESPAYTFALSRREFVGVVGAGLVISVAGKTALAQQPGGFGAAARGPLESRLHLGDDGTVTILTGKVEIGQGARTEFAMAVAEEMRVPLDR